MAFNQEDRERAVRNEERIIGVKEDIEVVHKRLDKIQTQFATKEELKNLEDKVEPIRKSVFTIVTGAVTTLVGAMITLAFKLFSTGSPPPGAH